MKQNAVYFVLGAVVGLVVGFFVTNYLNRPEFAVGTTTAQGQQPPAGGGAAQPQMPPPGGPGGGAPGGPNAGGPAKLSQADLDEVKRKLDPNKYEDQINFAEFLLRIQQTPADAIPYYETALKLRPDDLKPLVGLGDATFDSAAKVDDHGHQLYDSEQLKRATAIYERVLAKEPKNVNVRTDMGLTYFFRTPPDYDRAIAEYRKSLEIEPKHELTLQNLTAALSAKGLTDEARETLARLEAVKPNNAAIPQLRANIEKGQTGTDIPSH